MFLTSVLSVFALGAGVKVYRENKRKREMPWTVYAEKIERRKKKRWLGAQATEGLIQFKEERISPLFAPGVFTRQSDTRRLKPEGSSGTAEEEEISDAEKEMDRYFAVSLASLGLSAAGYLFYAPLGLISVPALLYPTAWIFKRSYQYIFKENRVPTGLIDIFFFGGTLVTGHYFACSLLHSFYFFSRKLLLKTEDHSRGSLINVFGEQPRFVWIQKEGLEVEVLFETVQLGDVVVVHAGQTIPVDGTVTSGHARVDQRALTGESQPVEKEAGHDVFAGTLLLSGRICIQVDCEAALPAEAPCGKSRQ